MRTPRGEKTLEDARAELYAFARCRFESREYQESVLRRLHAGKLPLAVRRALANVTRLTLIPELRAALDALPPAARRKSSRSVPAHLAHAIDNALGQAIGRSSRGSASTSTKRGSR